MAVVPGSRRPLPWWLWAAVALVAVVALNAAGLAYRRADAASHLLPGFTVIRPPYEVRALALDGDTLYAGGRDGLCAVQTGTLRVTQPYPSEKPPLGQVRGLLVEGDHTLWIAHERGVTRMRGSDAVTFTTRDGLPSDRAQCVFRASDGRVWVGTVAGAAVMDGDRFTPVTTKDGMLNDVVNTIAQDAYGGMWFGSYDAPRGGVSVLRDGRWYTFSKRDGLPHPNVTSFLRDGGSMWAGTGFVDRGGAVRFEVPAQGPPRIVQSLLKADGLAGEKVRSLFRGRDGTLWFGSEADGVAIGGPGRWSILTSGEGLSDNEVKCMVQDAVGRMWLGTRNGITMVRDPGTVLKRSRGTP
jgi:ligand-binding sensor domain-containing protein